MNKSLFITLLALLPLASWGDTGQTVTVDGARVNKTVKQITFSGTDATLTFADGSTQTADMDKVNIAFGTSSGITTVSKPTKTAAAKGIYTLSGQYVGQDKAKLPKGIYIINGKKEVVK